jgi:uncharacterized protein with HEPN domain
VIRSVPDRLADIAEAISDIQTFCAGASTVDDVLALLKDGRTFRAVKNALMEIGEAAKVLPQSLRERHAGIDWRGVAGLRDMIAHQYFRADSSLIATIVLVRLPALRDAVEAERERAAARDSDRRGS